jgi:hypothetical protein
VWSAYVLVNGFLTISLLALLAVITGSAFAFPSPGPTAYLLFIAPLEANSSPRNTILGHAIGPICGYDGYVVKGAASLRIWEGLQSNVPEAQRALLHRARCNSLAQDGQYNPAMEHSSIQPREAMALCA